ncbi:MAG: DNA polymerase III subunit alpha, partial [Ignavibacteria bacterium]|nr:DNA polymerase III subunit alpha [Ignavibacteria bacterium]
NTGYKNLIKLNSIGHTEGFYKKPRIDLEVLNKYREGIIALSACAGGVLSAYIVRDNVQKAYEMAGIYKDIFGEDFYCELQNHLTLESEKLVLKELPRIAKRHNIKLVATNDIHYLKKDHAIAHNIYLHISAKQSKNIDYTRITTDLRYGTEEIYFKSAEEMCNLFEDFPEAIKSTLEIAEKCNVNLDTKEYYMPKFPVPPEFSADKLNLKDGKTNLDLYLEKLAREGLKKKFKNITKEIEDRLEYELSIISKMKFSGYFLIVQDFIKAARERGILVGPGRGSAAGSLVCYCLGITNVNPLDYNLLFERFLNPERISMPDIDIDFQDDRRDEIIQYAKEKYGENAVAQIVTFNKLAARGVLKDVGRVLNFPFNEINELTKTIPILFGKIKPLSECIKEVPEFKNYFKTGTEEQKQNKKKLFEYSSILENLNKNSSIHASGIVITPSDVTDYVPLSKVPKENSFFTQYEMNSLEDAGLIKIDFLGLKELKVIQRTLDKVNKRYNLNLTPETIPLDDKKTYELFSNGATIGVFQFSKSKMREYLSKLKPKNINDLAAMNALYRPGPMKLIPDFIDKRFGRKPVSYMHPKLEKVLKETYGIIVYQEQAMQIAREIAGFTMAQADNMRKAMGKKIPEKMKQLKNDFIKGAIQNGVDKKIANEIFNLIQSFADYGFNKSHGVAYSILAFYTAYLKAHYPVEFLAVSLDCRKDNETELQQLAEECRRMGIKLKQPDVNSSLSGFDVEYKDNEKGIEEDSILYGLSAIKNVGEKAAENIVTERETNGKYTDFIDFLIRVDLRLVNKKAIEYLIYAGAFDSLETNRNKLFSNLERAMLYAQRYKEKPEAKGQELLFGITSESKSEKYRHTDFIFEEFVEFSEKEKFNKEKEAIGFFLTGHPLAKYSNIIKNFVNINFGEDITDLEAEQSLGNVRAAGVIANVQGKYSKKGNKFVTFELIDFYGTAECVGFNSLIENKGELIKNDNLVFVEGKAEENGDKIKLIIDNIYSIDKFQEKLASNIVINLYLEKNYDNELKVLTKLIDKFPGSCNLYLHICPQNENNQECKNGNGIFSRLFRIKNAKVKPTKEFLNEINKLFGEKNISIN